MSEYTLNDLVGTPQTVIANLILDHYALLGMDDHQLAIFLQIIKFRQLNENFPSPEQLAQVVRQPVTKVYQTLQELVKNGFLAVTAFKKDGQHHDQYDLTPFFNKLAQLQNQKNRVDQFQTQQAEISQLYKEFEVEFGRTLSPIEFETIDSWLNQDHYSVEIIRLALREAVLSDARSFKYLDRILLDWQRRQIKNSADLQRYKQKF
ncbi:MAG: DnaD domain protein [Lactobacillaceae bacterium]|jgi:DNA replication protein|nr:DnaD domain protein [Lactobacillaceae bacterium]